MYSLYKEESCMTDPTYELKLGTLNCTFLIDGYHNYTNPASILFADAPPAELDNALKRHGIDPVAWTVWRNAYPVVLVQTAQRTLLVDTGAGSFDRETGRLPVNLAALGVSLEDIDTVIITHAHPDHAGGTLTAKGGPAFPAARYVMWRREWEFWMGDASSGRAPDRHIAYARKQLGPIESRVDLIEPPVEIAPGVTLIAGSGHTPGQLLVELDSGSERLLSVSDLVAHPIHMEHPDWTISVEIDHAQVPAIRRDVLGRAARENLLLHVPHFDFPGLGHVQEDGGVWCWVPLQA
jgi:glyoxylase-like metal-dependent hydrolase (beta-lactamase superfamily II)